MVKNRQPTDYHSTDYTSSDHHSTDYYSEEVTQSTTPTPENLIEAIQHVTQPIITSTGVIDGFDNDAFIVTVCIIVGIAFILKLSYLQANDFVIWLQEDTRAEIVNQVNQQVSQTDIRNLVQSSTQDDCPICYEVFTLPVETNCRHTFCARCTIVCWETTEARGGGNTILSPLHCPMCRTEVSTLIPRFEFSEDLAENVGENSDVSDTDRQATIQHIKETNDKIKAYNRRFSNIRRGWWDYFTDIPLMLYHMWCEATGRTGLLLFCRLQVLIAVSACFMYVCLPFDIIPESVYGIVGIVDDVIILLTVLVYLSFLYRSIVLEQNVD